MVRMLGFSDKDKQRMSVAQQGASKGVVQGVLRLPGRLVGGILGGSSTEVVATAGSDNQVILPSDFSVGSHVYLIESNKLLFSSF